MRASSSSTESERHFEIVRLLLVAGANNDVADSKGRTEPLCTGGHRQARSFMRTFSKGHGDILRLPLEAGVNKDVAGLNFSDCGFR